MDFCPKCETRLKKNNDGLLSCPKCQFVKGKSADTIKEKSEEVIEDVSTKDPIAKEIYLSFRDSFARLRKWSKKSEQAYLSARDRNT